MKHTHSQGSERGSLNYRLETNLIKWQGYQEKGGNGLATKNQLCYNSHKGRMGNLPGVRERQAHQAVANHHRPRPALQMQTLWAGNKTQHRSA